MLTSHIHAKWLLSVFRRVKNYFYAIDHAFIVTYIGQQINKTLALVVVVVVVVELS